MKQTRSLATLTAEHGLDTVESIRAITSSAYEAVVGAYTLAADGERVGGLHLVKASTSPPAIESTSFLQLPAVLDVRVTGKTSNLALAACADGTLRGVRVPDLQLQWSADAGAMVTSLSVSQDDTNSALVALSCANGFVSLSRADMNGAQKLHDRRAHDAEAWTVDVIDANSVMSGGDDGILALTDWRVEIPTFKKRAHDGVGVTSVVCRGEHTLWTGGYDDHVRIWDRRAMKRSVTEANLGGGVWRLKFHPHEPTLVLVACMYNGFKVLRIDKASALHTIAHYEGHESIGYGAAWLVSDEESVDHELHALTASFYDKSLQLWSVAK